MDFVRQWSPTHVAFQLPYRVESTTYSFREAGHRLCLRVGRCRAFGVSDKVGKPFSVVVDGSRGLQGPGAEEDDSSSPNKLEEIESSKYLAKLVEKNELDKALEFLDSMVNRRMVPDLQACLPLIRGFCRIERVREAWRAMNVTEGAGLVPDVITYTVLIKVLCNLRQVDQALIVLHRMRVAPDVITYNTILNGLCRCGRLKQAVEIFRQQLENHCYPNVVTFNTLMNAICSEHGVDRAMVLLEEIKTKCTPDVITYSIIVNAMCNEGRVEEAAMFVVDMPSHGCSPNSFCFNHVVHGYCKQGKTEKAIEYLDIMVARGFRPSITNYDTLLAGLCSNGKVGKAVEILDQLHHRGCSPTSISYNIVIDGLCKTGKTDRAVELCYEMQKKDRKPNMVTYSLLAYGHCSEGKVDEAINLFRQLEEMGEELNYITVIRKLVKSRMTDCAIDFLAYMVYRGRKPNKIIYTSLVHGISSEGFIKEANELRYELRARGVIIR